MQLFTGHLEYSSLSIMKCSREQRVFTLTETMYHPQGLCTFVPGYNICILRGCSVCDSFVTVIGDQMALGRPVLYMYIDVLGRVNIAGHWRP